MEMQQDFKELLASLNENGVEFIVVGAYALAFHGVPRNTGDLDILVRPTPANATRILTALEAFGFGALGLSSDDFTSPDRVVQLGVPPVRVDFLTALTGVSWEQAFAGRVEGDYDGVPVAFIGRSDLVVNKRTTGRARDLADLEALGEA